MSHIPPHAPGAEATDSSNNNVRFHQALEKWVYTDKDGVEYEYDEEKKAW
jgi:hypothetical protein